MQIVFEYMEFVCSFLNIHSTVQTFTEWCAYWALSIEYNERLLLFIGDASSLISTTTTKLFKNVWYSRAYNIHRNRLWAMKLCYFTQTLYNSWLFWYSQKMIIILSQFFFFADAWCLLPLYGTWFEGFKYCIMSIEHFFIL